MSEICEVFKIIHRKNGVYDLFQDDIWVMSRGCVDDILEHISKKSEIAPVVFEFKDESMG